MISNSELKSRTSRLYSTDDLIAHVRGNNPNTAFNLLKDNIVMHSNDITFLEMLLVKLSTFDSVSQNYNKYNELIDQYQIKINPLNSVVNSIPFREFICIYSEKARLDPDNSSYYFDKGKQFFHQLKVVMLGMSKPKSITTNLKTYFVEMGPNIIHYDPEVLDINVNVGALDSESVRYYQNNCIAYKTYIKSMVETCKETSNYINVVNSYLDLLIKVSGACLNFTTDSDGLNYGISLNETFYHINNVNVEKIFTELVTCEPTEQTLKPGSFVNSIEKAMESAESKESKKSKKTKKASGVSFGNMLRAATTMAIVGSASGATPPTRDKINLTAATTTATPTTTPTLVPQQGTTVTPSSVPTLGKAGKSLVDFVGTVNNFSDDVGAKIAEGYRNWSAPTATTPAGTATTEGATTTSTPEGATESTPAGNGYINILSNPFGSAKALGSYALDSMYSGAASNFNKVITASKGMLISTSPVVLNVPQVINTETLTEYIKTSFNVDTIPLSISPNGDYTLDLSGITLPNTNLLSVEDARITLEFPKLDLTQVKLDESTGRTYMNDILVYKSLFEKKLSTTSKEYSTFKDSMFMEYIRKGAIKSKKGANGKILPIEITMKILPYVPETTETKTTTTETTATGTPATGTPATGTPATGTPATGTPATAVTIKILVTPDQLPPSMYINIASDIKYTSENNPNTLKDNLYLPVYDTMSNRFNNTQLTEISNNPNMVNFFVDTCLSEKIDGVNAQLRDKKGQPNSINPDHVVVDADGTIYMDGPNKPLDIPNIPVGLKMLYANKFKYTKDTKEIDLKFGGMDVYKYGESELFLNVDAGKVQAVQTEIQNSVNSGKMLYYDMQTVKEQDGTILKKYNYLYKYESSKDSWSWISFYVPNANTLFNTVYLEDIVYRPNLLEQNMTQAISIETNRYMQLKALPYMKEFLKEDPENKKFESVVDAVISYHKFNKETDKLKIDEYKQIITKIKEGGAWYSNIVSALPQRVQSILYSGDKSVEGKLYEIFTSIDIAQLNPKSILNGFDSKLSEVLYTVLSYGQETKIVNKPFFLAAKSLGATPKLYMINVLKTDNDYFYYGAVNEEIPKRFTQDIQAIDIDSFTRITNDYKAKIAEIDKPFILNTQDSMIMPPVATILTNTHNYYIDGAASVYNFLIGNGMKPIRQINTETVQYEIIYKIQIDNTKYKIRVPRLTTQANRDSYYTMKSKELRVCLLESIECNQITTQYVSGKNIIYTVRTTKGSTNDKESKDNVVVEVYMPEGHFNDIYLDDILNNIETYTSKGKKHPGYKTEFGGSFIGGKTVTTEIGTTYTTSNIVVTESKESLPAITITSNLNQDFYAIQTIQEIALTAMKSGYEITDSAITLGDAGDAGIERIASYSYMLDSVRKVSSLQYVYGYPKVDTTQFNKLTKVTLNSLKIRESPKLSGMLSLIGDLQLPHIYGDNVLVAYCDDTNLAFSKLIELKKSFTADNFVVNNEGVITVYDVKDTQSGVSIRLLVKQNNKKSSEPPLDLATRMLTKEFPPQSDTSPIQDLFIEEGYVKGISESALQYQNSIFSSEHAEQIYQFGLESINKANSNKISLIKIDGIDRSLTVVEVPNQDILNKMFSTLALGRPAWQIQNLEGKLVETDSGYVAFILEKDVGELYDKTTKKQTRDAIRLGDPITIRNFYNNFQPGQYISPQVINKNIPVDLNGYTNSVYMVNTIYHNVDKPVIDSKFNGESCGINLFDSNGNLQAKLVVSRHVKSGSTRIFYTLEPGVDITLEDLHTSIYPAMGGGYSIFDSDDSNTVNIGKYQIQVTERTLKRTGILSSFSGSVIKTMEGKFNPESYAVGIYKQQEVKDKQIADAKICTLKLEELNTKFAVIDADIIKTEKSVEIIKPILDGIDITNLEKKPENIVLLEGIKTILETNYDSTDASTFSESLTRLNNLTEMKLKDFTKYSKLKLKIIKLNELKTNMLNEVIPKLNALKMLK